MLFLLIIIIVDANLVTVSSSEAQRSDSSPKAALLVCGRDMIASSERNFSRSRRPRKGEQIFRKKQNKNKTIKTSRFVLTYF